MGRHDLGLVDNLSDAGRRVLVDNLIRKHFAKDARVIDRGDSVSGAYIVLEGALRVFAMNAGGREATLYRIEPGETCILALNALFNDVLYPAWVEAESDSVVGVLPGRVFRSLFATEPSVQDVTIRALSSVVFGLMSELDRRSTNTVEQRLAAYLLLRASADGTVRNTQQELADRIGTSREVVGRLMARLAAEGIVRTRRGLIAITDRAGLSRILGEDPADG